MFKKCWLPCDGKWTCRKFEIWSNTSHDSWTMCNAIKHDIGINYILCAASIKSVGSSHLQQFNSPQISSRRTNLKSSISQSPRKSVRVFLEELPKPGCVILLFCSHFSCFTPCTSIPHLKSIFFNLWNYDNDVKLYSLYPRCQRQWQWKKRYNCLSLIDNFKSLSLALYNRVRCLLTLSVSRLVGPGARRRGRRRRLAVLGGRGLLGLPRPLLRPRTRPRTGAPAQETLSQTNRYI